MSTEARGFEGWKPFKTSAAKLDQQVAYEKALAALVVLLDAPDPQVRLSAAITILGQVGR